MNNMKYKMTALTIKPGKNVLFYTIRSPEGEMLCVVKDKTDARKLIKHLNRVNKESL
jgi:hypothetical protein